MIVHRSHTICAILFVAGMVIANCHPKLKEMNSNPKNEELPDAKPVTKKYFTAVINGDTAAVKKYLLNGFDVNTKDPSNETGIIIATDRNDVAMVNVFLEHGADVNLASYNIDNTPIMIASVKGYTKMVQLLIDKSKPDMTILNGYGGTALIPACEKGHVEIVKLLLEKTNVKVNHINNLGWTALLEAIILSNGGKSQQEIVRLLLAHGADKQIADKNGVTPLEHAKKNGLKELTEILSD